MPRKRINGTRLRLWDVIWDIPHGPPDPPGLTHIQWILILRVLEIRPTKGCSQQN